MADDPEQDDTNLPDVCDRFVQRQASFLRQRAAVLRPRTPDKPATQNPADDDQIENDRKAALEEFRRRQRDSV